MSNSYHTVISTHISNWFLVFEGFLYYLYSHVAVVAQSLEKLHVYLVRNLWQCMNKFCFFYKRNYYKILHWPTAVMLSIRRVPMQIRFTISHIHLLEAMWNCTCSVLFCKATPMSPNTGATYSVMSCKATRTSSRATWFHLLEWLCSSV